MGRKMLSVILAAAVILVSGCSGKETANIETTSAASPSESEDIAFECGFYADEIIYIDGKLLRNEETMVDAMYEGDYSGMKNAIAQCRQLVDKAAGLSCPCEQMSQLHEGMLAEAEKYAEFLDSMERYAYFLEEGATRTDFTDEEMIEIQELAETTADPYIFITPFQNSRLAAFEAAASYAQ